MPSPVANWARRVAAAAAVVAAASLPAPAHAAFRVTFTGPLDYSDYFSSRFDGTDSFDDDLPPLFDLGRLAGGSFRATSLVPDVPPVDEDSGYSLYEYVPPVPAGIDLLDPTGAVVHRLRTGLYEVEVENFETRPTRGRPPIRVNEATFLAVPDGFGGLDAPPELYGPNRFVVGTVAAYFTRGTRPLGDVSIPAAGATYLGYADREFFIRLDVANGDPNGDDPNLYVSTTLGYQITGVSVAPTASVPEPASVGLAAAAGLALVGYARRRGQGRANVTAAQ